MLSHSSKEEWNILTPLELLSHMNCEFCQATFKGFFFFLCNCENCLNCWVLLISLLFDHFLLIMFFFFFKSWLSVYTFIKTFYFSVEKNARYSLKARHRIWPSIFKVHSVMQIFYIYYCEWRFKNTSRNTNLNYKLRRNRRNNSK